MSDNISSGSFSYLLIIIFDCCGFFSWGRFSCILFNAESLITGTLFPYSSVCYSISSFLIGLPHSSTNASSSYILHLLFLLLIFLFINLLVVGIIDFSYFIRSFALIFNGEIGVYGSFGLYVVVPLFNFCSTLNTPNSRILCVSGLIWLLNFDGGVLLI
jgi:hypothetical protein